MPLLPVELRNTADGANAVDVVERGLNAARKRIARGRTLRTAASTLALPIAASASWIALARFTLLEIPGWPVLLFIPIWIAAMFVVTRRHRVTASQSARFLDHALALDERASTLLELARSTPLRYLSSRQSNTRVPFGLLEDTAFQLKASMIALPSPWRYRMRKWQSAAIACTLLALVACILIPTSLDAVRAEQSALRRTVEAELQKISDLKAELVSRPGLLDDDRNAVAAELDRLHDALSDPQLDRSALLASLSDAQGQLQQISPQTSADFSSILAASRTVQIAATNVSRNAPVGTTADWDWSPDNFPDLSELEKGASAAEMLGSRIKFMSAQQIRLAVPLLERASTQAAPDDSQLGQHLLDASRAVDAKDVERGVQELHEAALRFHEADHKWQLTQSVEKIMANLDDGRQTLAQAGTQTAKKGQVGFRRPGAPGNPAQDGQGASGTRTDDPQNVNAGAQDGHGLSLDGPSALGANMGSNSPDYRGTNAGSPGASGDSSAGSNSNSQSTGGGSGGATQPGVAGSAGASQPGAGASGTGDGTQGTFSGQVSGPMGGGAGAISQVPNPQGQGIGAPAPATQDSTEQIESIYVPGSDATISEQTDAGGVPGQAAPEQKPGGVTGRPGNVGGESQTTSDTGAGSRNQIRTPYRDVIGQYAEQATQALERVYVPADAKEYVKEYFSELGK